MAPGTTFTASTDEHRQIASDYRRAARDLERRGLAKEAATYRTLADVYAPELRPVGF